MYCKSFKDDYDYIFWVSADTEQKILSQLSEHAIQLKLGGSDPRTDDRSNAVILLTFLEHLGLLS